DDAAPVASAAVIRARRYSTTVLYASFIAIVCPAMTVAAAESSRLPAVVTAERSAPGHPAAAAGDDNLNTPWMADAKPAPANNAVWVQLDLGQPRDVARLHWIASRGYPYPAWSPTSYRVLASDDGSNWRVVADVSRRADHDDRDGPLTINIRTRYLRL